MCDHHGGFAETGSISGSIDRRAFLGHGAAGAIAIGLPLGILGGGSSGHASATFKGTHDNGFCNSAFFSSPTPSSAQTHSESTGRRLSLARMAFADWAQTNGFG